MHIVAFNSSPRDNETSKTEMVLQSFLAGARRAGAESQTVYLRNYRIRHCLGCFHCWLKTPGRCVQQDDMSEQLFAKVLQADLVVLATPLYHYTMNARMKAFIERTLPMMLPTFVDLGERTDHPYRGQKVPRLVALSVCAFPEQSNFQALSLNMRMIFGPRLVAEIYRHSSEFLDIPHLQPQVNQVMSAVAQAGEEVVRQGGVSPETLAGITQELAPRKMLIDLANQYWQQELAKEQERFSGETK
jgi:multimeric flavodoxin WrbA